MAKTSEIRLFSGSRWTLTDILGDNPTKTSRFCP